MPCVAELPHLVKVAQEFDAEGGRVIGVSEDLFVPDSTEASSLAAAKKVMAERGVAFPVFIVKDRTLDGLNALFLLPGPIPVTLALDQDGREVDREEGGADEARFRQMMRRALGKER
jgi:thiol-disulfide isomerase/thioredoxin